MFKKEDCYPVGIFVKTLGIAGELVLKKYNNLLEEYNKESVFVDIDGGLVPFFLVSKGVKQHSSKALRVRFDDVASESMTLRLIGCEVYILRKDAPLLPEEKETSLVLEGFRFIDEKHGELGIIEKVLNYSGNTLLQLSWQTKEILIPFAEENLLEINEEEKIIRMNTPNGLLDI